MFLGINMFLTLLTAHFNPRYARAKMILSRERQLYCYIIPCIYLEGPEGGRVVLFQFPGPNFD